MSPYQTAKQQKDCTRLLVIKVHFSKFAVQRTDHWLVS
uniref:Uncharacterized protein n=1 Tax=Anguilla anguilla TaxID=7936 RepID=A0A0E9QH49_ANGAN